MIDTKVLAAPLIFRDDQVIRCDEQVLRKLPIQHALNLEREKWIVMYERRNQAVAREVVSTMKKACSQLKIRVEDPKFIEI